MAVALLVIGILLFPTSLVTLQLISPVYLHDYYHFPFSNIYLALTCSYIWSAITIPLFGWFADKNKKKPLIIMAAIITIVFAFPFFRLLQIRSMWSLFSFFMFLQTVIAMMTASYLGLLATAFPTIIRYTGTAFTYNIADTITAFLPLAVNYFYGVWHNPNYLVWLLITLATTSIICTIRTKVSSPGRSP